MKPFGFVLVTVLVGVASAITPEEEEGKKWMEEENKKSFELFLDYEAKNWAAASANDANSAKANEDLAVASKNYNAHQREVYPKMMSFPWKTFEDQDTKRMFFIGQFIEESGLSDDKSAKLQKIQTDINNVYSTALFKEYQSSNDKPTLNPDDLDTKVNKDYKNAEEMAFYWKEKHDTVGKPVKNLFTQWVAIETEVANINGYKNIAEYFQAKYEIDNFENTMLELYKQIEPLFKELHAYVRYKLWDLYGKQDNIVDPKGPLPGSLLTYRWGQDVTALYNVLKPYPKKPDLDIAQKLKDKGYTQRKIAEDADKFYESLGFDKMPEDFWSQSIFEKKPDMSSCSSTSSYDLGNGNERLLTCAEPSYEEYGMMYAIFGYFQFNRAVAKLPYFFQRFPSTAFDNGFEKTMYFFGTSTNYLKSLGVLDSDVQLDKELEINILFTYAIDNVFYLPWAYTYDSWRWSVLEGKITPENYNCEYWKIRTKLQGVEPPVDRDESGFDVGLHTWFAAGGQYIQYYIGEFVKYDMIRGLCQTAGDKNDLVYCDISNNKAVGEKLKAMMALGDSRPWYDALEKLTGRKTLDASALLEFYQPLLKWLQEENKKNQVTVGWTPGNNRCR